MNGMTKTEHLRWCIDKAKREMEFYGELRQGVASLLSDLAKHNETRPLIDPKKFTAIMLNSDDTAFWALLTELEEDADA